MGGMLAPYRRWQHGSGRSGWGSKPPVLESQRTARVPCGLLCINDLQHIKGTPNADSIMIFIVIYYPSIYCILLMLHCIY
jgi:hypothetical protein